MKAWAEAVSVPTYLPDPPEKNPVFSERRVYPLPFVSGAAKEKTPYLWQAIHLENEFIRVMILPELGGKIHLGLDKTNGYDFLHRQDAISPVSAGLPVSGGVEFLWPQQDRPAACLPVSTYMEEGADGSRTVWCSGYDPISRVKGMHGVCLYPSRAYIELKVRVFNRTPFVQSFAWWANAAVPAQEFFPPDSAVRFSEDFFGGYDGRHQAGLVYVADHHIAPGKKQGKGELMAGVYTSHQPGSSFLAPFETKVFSQFWYPIQAIGPAEKANVDAAISLRLEGESARIGVCVTRAFPKGTIVLRYGETVLAQWTYDLHPGAPVTETATLPFDVRPEELTLKVLTSAGRPLISYTPHRPEKTELPQAVTELPLPRKVETAEELYFLGLRLLQDRRLMRQPEEYWREALRRNKGDSRCNNAIGLRYLWRGDFIEAEAHFRRAIATLTAWNPNPYDGESFYHLGLALRYQERDDEAYDAFYKATWSFGWRAPALYAIAELDTKRGNYGVVPKHLYEALRLNADNNYARNLAAVLFRRFGKANEADGLLRESLTLDPLDAWACYLSGRQMPGNNQVRLDLAFDYARAGLYEAAIEVLTAADTFVADGTLPMVHYALAGFYVKTGDISSAQREYGAASQSSPDYCFPHRLEEMAILARAVALQPHDARAQYYLGNLLYDCRRHEEAIELWESSARLDGSFAMVWRNLGISYYNIRNDPAKAFEAFDKALSADPADVRVVYERDQLWKRMGIPPALRLKELEERQTLAESRDDFAMEMAALFNHVQQPVRALALLSSRQSPFSMCETGLALEQHVRTYLKLGRQALNSGDPMRALDLFFTALNPSADVAEVQFWIGEAYQAAHDFPAAQEHWRQAAGAKTNLENSIAKPYSEMTFYSGLALARLGERFASRNLLRQLWFHGRKLAREKSQQVNYSDPLLPDTVPFKEDFSKRSRVTGLFLQAQARLGLSQYKLARNLLQQVLALDPNHGRALDLTAELTQEQ